MSTEVLFDNEQGVNVLRRKIYVRSVFDKSVAVFCWRSIHVPVKKPIGDYVDSIVISIRCESCRNCGCADIELKRFDLVDEDLTVLEVVGICESCAFPKSKLCTCCNQFPCEDYIIPVVSEPDLCECCSELPCVNYKRSDSSSD